MVRRDAKILTSAGAGLPFGKLVTVLKTRVEHEDGATPDV